MKNLNKKLLKFIILRSPPAGGKTTIAKALVAKDPKNWVRVNRDDFRFMINDYYWGLQDIENLITKITHNMVEEALRRGFNVISDDANMKQKAVNQWHAIAEKVGNVTVVEKYIEIPLKEAIRRDAAREKTVGEDVIRNFYKRYVKGLKLKPETYYPPVDRSGKYIKQDQTLPKAIICDIDGTRALMNGKRGPFEEHNVYRDDINVPVEWLLTFVDANNSLYEEIDWGEPAERSSQVKVIYLSGRSRYAEEETIRWFKEKAKEKVVYGDNLFMRAKDDSRKDSVIKRELFDAHIKDKYNVLFVLDDRNQVVDNWRQDIGLPCFQVDEGNF